MSEPRLIASHQMRCAKSDKCSTEAIVNVYECGCRRVTIVNPSDETNSCMKQFRGLNYTAAGCRSKASQFVSEVAWEVTKRAAVAAISAAVTGGAIVMS